MRNEGSAAGSRISLFCFYLSAHQQKQPPLAEVEHWTKVLLGGMTSMTTTEVSSFRPPCARRMEFTILSGASCGTWDFKN